MAGIYITTSTRDISEPTLTPLCVPCQTDIHTRSRDDNGVSHVGEIGLSLRCGHLFGHRCLGQWIAHQCARNRTVTCPDCRAVIEGDVCERIARMSPPANAALDAVENSEGDTNSVLGARGESRLYRGVRRRRPRTERGATRPVEHGESSDSDFTSGRASGNWRGRLRRGITLMAETATRQVEYGENSDTDSMSSVPGGRAPPRAITVIQGREEEGVQVESLPVEAATRDRPYNLIERRPLQQPQQPSDILRHTLLRSVNLASQSHHTTSSGGSLQIPPLTPHHIESQLRAQVFWLLRHLSATDLRDLNAAAEAFFPWVAIGYLPTLGDLVNSGTSLMQRGTEDGVREAWAFLVKFHELADRLRGGD